MQRLAASLTAFAATVLAAVTPLASQAGATEPSPAVLPPGHLVVLGRADSSVTVLDTATGETTTCLEAPVVPHEAIAQPDGHEISLAGDGTAVVVDATSREIVARSADGANPDGIAWAPPPDP